jgi:hypothetical protein
MAVCSLQKSQKAVYIWLAANLLQRSALHKLAYHSQIGKRSFTRPVSPDLYTDHARCDRIVTREKRKLEWCSEASISSLHAIGPTAMPATPLRQTFTGFREQAIRGPLRETHMRNLNRDYCVRGS